MARVSQKSNGKGSLKLLQMLVNNYTSLLDEKIKEEIPRLLKSPSLSRLGCKYLDGMLGIEMLRKPDMLSLGET